jgi:hypothetical protein
MKKEVFLAISIGFILGLIITFGIWTANKSLKQTSPGTPTPTQTIAQISQAPTPTSMPSNQISLNISSPANEILTNASTTNLSGKTVPGAFVAVLFESGETILTASSTGDFSFDIPLEGGFNRISVRAYDQNGQSSTQNLIVTYTTQKI